MALDLKRSLFALVIVMSLVAAACSSDSDTGDTEAQDTTTTSQETATASTVTETTTQPDTASNAVAGLKNVRGAVVRIVAEGSFIDPAEGAVTNEAGSGSGFLISEDGLAITNNHVVTGAALLEVYVEGEDAPRNARILGVSECSDLAVIDIDGAEFPYLEWYDGELAVGTDIYVAGFPLGDPEYTLTEGIISKENADGESTWSSIDSVLEITAKILPGNSGGPLVVDSGQVAGVNYAYWEERDISYSISRDEAIEVIGELIAGDNVDSIGINGEAFVDDTGSGIWVAAVESGSPAADLGIKGGDIITKLEGLVLATDGTMADYCDIMRTQGDDQPMSVEVLRYDTQEVLTGTLNGDKELELAFSFADQLEDDITAADTQYEYTEVTDDTGTLVMQIPTAWVDVSGLPWVESDEEIGIAIAAAPDLAGFFGTWDVPGVFFGASDVLYNRTDPGDVLDGSDFSNDCTYDDRYDYEDAVYTGAYDVWLNCGGTDTALVELEAYADGVGLLVNVQVQVVTDADLEALDTILATFDMTG
jgi:serine protease Do